MGNTKRITYFGLHYLYFFLCVLLGVARIYLTINFPVKVTFLIFIGAIFILVGIVGLVVNTVELILFLKGEDTD